eukprot:jgi/Botrbrau1/19453/Bobra.0338s0073.1
MKDMVNYWLIDLGTTLQLHLLKPPRSSKAKVRKLLNGKRAIVVYLPVFQGYISLEGLCWSVSGADGTGNAIGTQISGLLAAGFDVRALYIPPDDRSGWESLTAQTIHLLLPLLEAEPGNTAGVWGCTGIPDLLVQTRLLGLFPEPLLNVAQAVVISLLVRRSQVHPATRSSIWKMTNMSPPPGFLESVGVPQRESGSQPPEEPQDAVIDEEEAEVELEQPRNSRSENTSWRLELLRHGNLPDHIISSIKTSLVLRQLVVTVAVTDGPVCLLPSLEESARLLSLMRNSQRIVLPDSGHTPLLEDSINLAALLRQTLYPQWTASFGRSQITPKGGSSDSAVPSSIDGTSPPENGPNGSSVPLAGLELPGSHPLANVPPSAEQLGGIGAGPQAYSPGGSLGGPPAQASSSGCAPEVPAPTLSQEGAGAPTVEFLGKEPFVAELAGAMPLVVREGIPELFIAVTASSIDESDFADPDAMILPVSNPLDTPFVLPTKSVKIVGSIEGTAVGASQGKDVAALPAEVDLSPVTTVALLERSSGEGETDPAPAPRFRPGQGNGKADKQLTPGVPCENGQTEAVAEQKAQGAVEYGFSPGTAPVASGLATGVMGTGAGPKKPRRRRPATADIAAGDVGNTSQWSPLDHELEQLTAMVAPLRAITSPVVEGTEHLPVGPRRPLLFVGNHTLYGLYDLTFLMVELYLRGYKVRGLAHPGHWRGPLGQIFERYGAVKASPMEMYRLLSNGEAVLLFPGGAKEVNKRQDENTRSSGERHPTSSGWQPGAMPLSFPLLPWGVTMPMMS